MRPNTLKVGYLIPSFEGPNSMVPNNYSAQKIGVAIGLYLMYICIIGNQKNYLIMDIQQILDTMKPWQAELIEKCPLNQQRVTILTKFYSVPDMVLYLETLLEDVGDDDNAGHYTQDDVAMYNANIDYLKSQLPG